MIGMSSTYILISFISGHARITVSSFTNRKLRLYLHIEVRGVRGIVVGWDRLCQVTLGIIS